MKTKKLVPLALATLLSLLAVNVNPVFANENVQSEKSFPNEALEEAYVGTSSDAKLIKEASESAKADVDVYATMYDVWVGGTQVSSDNMDDVMGDGTESVKYEPAYGTKRAKLILNNLNASVLTRTCTEEKFFFIKADEEIDLVITGNNTINIISAGGVYTDLLKYIYGIYGENIYCSGGGALNININADVATENLTSIYAMYISSVPGEGSFENVNINIDIHVFAKYIFGIADFTDIKNSNISIKSKAGYNTALGEVDYRGLVNLIYSYNDCNIASSNIMLTNESDTGLGSDKADLYGIRVGNGALKTSGATSINISGVEHAIQAKEAVFTDTYKVNLDGSVSFYNSENVGIKFEKMAKGSYFTAKASNSKGALNCLSDVAEGSAKFKIPAKTLVIAGDNEANARPITKDELDKLFFYESKAGAEPTEKFIKVGYKCTVSFEANGGSGIIYDDDCIEGAKYALPDCTFTPYSGYRFKAWEVNGTQYAPGNEVVISDNTTVTAIWQRASSGGSGGSGGGGGRGAGGAKGGATAPKKQSGMWIKDNVGWWYMNMDGSYPKASWQKIDNVWYVFNDAGYMVTGWCLSGGKWYYLNANGAMSTGWIQVKDKWYYLETVGKADKPQGSMYASENTPDNYRVNKSGEWVR